MSLYKDLKGYWTFIYGKIEAEYEQVAFDLILKDFGIENYNIVKISSILPKGFKYTNTIKGLPEEGEILYMAYVYKFFTKEEVIKNFDKKFSIGVLVVEPENKEQTGLILELSDFCDKQTLEEKLELQARYLSAIRRKIEVKEVRKKIIETDFLTKIHKKMFFKPFGMLVGVLLW
jgi:pyruvoyl-dependent arginine decarboxylase